ncbi:MAG TPA: replication initiator protein A [Gemmatimonadales bacterium]|nr:replication initiator protein A [Gemmatimonadales bacterium]
MPEQLLERRARDLSDFAEFPIFDLSEKSNSAAWKRVYESRGKQLEIRAHPEDGVPNHIDGEVYVALLIATHGKNPREPVHFVRRTLLTDMGWPATGPQYARLDLALRRLQSTTLYTRNLIHDPATKQYRSERAYSLLAGYSLQEPKGEQHQPCWFRWSPDLADLIAAGYTHPLETKTYFSLKSPIAQTALRYLSCRMRDGKSLYEEHLLTFAQQRLGLRQQYVSKIKEKLAAPLAELMEKTGINSVTYGALASGEFKGQPKIIFKGRFRVIDSLTPQEPVPVAPPKRDVREWYNSLSERDQRLKWSMARAMLTVGDDKPTEEEIWEELARQHSLKGSAC